MKILVPCKRVPDPDQKLRLNAEATDIDPAALTYILNPFDAIAVEEALRIRETAHPDAEIIAVSIAPAEGEADLRTALAMGADRALLIEHAGPIDPWNIARLLAAVIEREQPTLVLMGKQAVDDDANRPTPLASSHLRLANRVYRRRPARPSRDRPRDRGHPNDIARYRHRRPPPQRTPLRLPPQHFARKEKIHRTNHPRRIGSAARTPRPPHRNGTHQQPTPLRKS